MEKLNIVAVNGSPRKNKNTTTLLDCAVKGAESLNAVTKKIDLYSLNYKGCISCFYCKNKSKPHGICAVQDDLTQILTD